MILMCCQLSSDGEVFYQVYGDAGLTEDSTLPTDASKIIKPWLSSVQASFDHLV